MQLTNRLLCFWADGGFVYYKRVSSPSFLVSSQSVNNNIVVCNRTGWDKNWMDFNRKGRLQVVYESADLCNVIPEHRNDIRNNKSLRFVWEKIWDPYGKI